jgi:hypothetical protein
MFPPLEKMWMVTNLTTCFTHPVVPLNANWIAEHAFQADRMLVGGVEIVGLFHVVDGGTEDVHSGILHIVTKKFLRTRESVILFTLSVERLSCEEWILGTSGKVTMILPQTED